MVLEEILLKTKNLILPILSSLAVACGSCDETKLIPAECDPLAVEICNNYKDDNCNGILNEGCDEDNDGYCSIGKEEFITYTFGRTPEICLKTFGKCSPELECPPQVFNYDCNDHDSSINPEAVERCNGVDDDCDFRTDESFPEQGQKCGPGLGENLELDRIGRCSAGDWTCTDGNLTCLNYIGPAEKELCNEIADTCGLEPETVQTEARPCYYEYRPDSLGNVIKIELPLSDRTIGVGTCISGIELCIQGVIGGDNQCHGAKLPEPEIPDCKDNDCDNEVDEGLHNRRKLQYAAAVDTSGSMHWIIDSIKQWFSSVRIPDCFSDENIRMSTIRMGDNNAIIYEPILKKSRVSVREFRTNFNADIPGAVGPHDEPSGNTIVYTACAVIEQQINSGISTEQLPETCANLLNLNSLREEHPRNPLQQPVYDPDAQKTLIVITDERYQWISGQMEITPRVGQQEAADLIRQAGINIIVFTNLNYKDHITTGTYQGYGYFEDIGGKVLDIATVNPADYLERLIQQDYWRP